MQSIEIYPGILVVIVQVLFDRSDKLPHVAETAPPDALVGAIAEPALDQVQPGTRSGDKVQVEPRMPAEPGFHPRVRVGPVIVHDQMQIELGRRLGVDCLEEPDEFLVPMPRHAVADDFPIEHAQGRKQGGRAVAFVVVRHRSTAAFLQRKARLGAIEGLDLALLVDAQDQGLVRWIEVEPDDIVELLDKVRVPADLEGPDEMGLEVVSLPDTPNRRLAEALGLGHAPRAPVGRGWRCRVQRGLDDCPDFAFGDAGDTTGTRSVRFQTRQSQGQKPLPPELHRGSGNFQFPGDGLIEDAIRGHLNDPCTLHQSEWETPAMRPSGQGRALFGRQQDRGGRSHVP